MGSDLLNTLPSSQDGHDWLTSLRRLASDLFARRFRLNMLISVTKRVYYHVRFKVAQTQALICMAYSFLHHYISLYEGISYNKHFI